MAEEAYLNEGSNTPLQINTGSALSNTHAPLGDDGNRNPFYLDQAEPIEQRLFPNPPRNGGRQTPTTIPNVEHMLRKYGIVTRYNVIKKKLLITVPGCSGSPDNADSVAMAQIICQGYYPVATTGTDATPKGPHIEGPFFLCSGSPPACG